MTSESQPSFPWTQISHNWSDSSIFDADRNLICTSSIEGDATEENQEQLEREQTERLNLILTAVNNTYGKGINPEAVEEMRVALEGALCALRRHVPESHGIHPNPEFEVVEQVQAALTRATLPQ